jgi:hypothetical protein
MRRDALELAVLVLALSALVTVHITLLVGLLRTRPRWHAAVALLVPPFAPYWGARQGLRARAIAWLALAATYAGALFVAYR